MNSHSYCARILPLINLEMQVKLYLALMQDNSPYHKSDNTKTEPYQFKISPNHLSASSPDLNLIDSLWNTIKDYIAIKCREGGESNRRRGWRRKNSHARLTVLTLED